MELIEVYREVERNINKVDFDILWPGFKKLKFAIYNDSLVCLDGEVMKRTPEFLANTALLYKGEYIAIFKVYDNDDIDILSSKMIHEMYHCFQMINEEERFPDEMTNLFTYQYDALNLSQKIYENRIITDLIKNFDSALYFELLASRKQRFLSHSQEYQYEASIEQIEGTANYVELASLKQINRQKYYVKLEEMQKNILDIDELIPIRIISYDIGALLIKIIKDNGLACDFSFSKKLFTEGLIEDLEPGKAVPVNSLIANKLLDFTTSLSKLVEESIKEEPIIAGDFGLLGLNIYNAKSICLEGNFYLTSTFFVIYQDQEERKTIHGDFVIQMKGNRISQIFSMKKQ